MDQDLSTANGSFIGEHGWDHSGYCVSDLGDVNSDGYDDILIGARYNDDGGADAGKSYLILGKRSGWMMNAHLSIADASFIGEEAGDNSGYSVSGAGDVNGDGYDDIIIGAFYNDEASTDSGKTYLLYYYEDVTKTPEKPEVLLSVDGGHLSINWNPVNYWGNLVYDLYRSEDGINYDKINTLDSDVLSYFDFDVKIGREYSYTVSTTSHKGDESPFSPSVKVLNEPDTDQDGIGNSYDEDDDGDGIRDRFDLNPLVQDGKRWSRQDIDLGTFGVGFIGEDASDYSGRSVSGAGVYNRLPQWITDLQRDITSRCIQDKSINGSFAA
ncbi:MAG: hypothetical protein U9R75_02300, partial [Candidatus Thermoplasmatota archaeon]|nr:hypothetical protein [Candidatus Thermoplasmatota archaeon]